MLAKDVEREAKLGRQISVSDLATATGRSRAAIYRAVRTGELGSTKLGRTPMILPHEALRMLGIEPEPEMAAAA
ncbi:hypothetical protein [Methylobacterium sp. SyP6R]|uniref:hypothetical protein n=1 Tax=Methylobacterium sp. SyP6R TaxID=2718876 RepID=UPI001F47D813|nr:hypothetical protein [Methylobacterium sp. SyP6R]MCF4123849.1 hypothetical protein [Methylobacterium sp. SyP6R]